MATSCVGKLCCPYAPLAAANRGGCDTAHKRAQHLACTQLAEPVLCSSCFTLGYDSSAAAHVQAQRDLMAVLSADNHGQDLARMGVLTGLAVGLHNLVGPFV